MRIACVVVPHFLVAVERRDDPSLRGRPVVVGGAPEERKEVQDCSPEATARGVHPGMSLREALSRCPEAAFVQAHPERYRATTQAMVEALLKISPLVESAEPGVLYLGIPPTRSLRSRGLGSGVWGLGASQVRCPPNPQPPPPDPYRFETEVAQIVATAAKRASRLAVEVGIADGKFTAYLSAERGTRNAECAYSALRTSHSELDELPVETLPISAEMQRRLRLLGLRRLGDLAQLPAGAVAAQFGAEGARAWELAQGRDHSPLVPYQPPRTLTERLAFPSPVVASDQLIAAIRMLLEHAVHAPIRGKTSALPLLAGAPAGQESAGPTTGNRLQGTGYRGTEHSSSLTPDTYHLTPVTSSRLAARSLLLRLHFEDGQAWERQVTFREPVSSPERMLVALRPKIESAIASGALAPCTEVELSLLGVCGENVSQLHLFPSSWQAGLVTGRGNAIGFPPLAAGPARERVAEAARQLKARYGRPMLAQILEVEPWSRIPERRFALIDYDP